MHEEKEVFIILLQETFFMSDAMRHVTANKIVTYRHKKIGLKTRVE